MKKKNLVQKVQNYVRGAVKIVVEDVLRVRMVYVAIYLNIDYASG